MTVPANAVAMVPMSLLNIDVDLCVESSFGPKVQPINDSIMSEHSSTS